MPRCAALCDAAAATQADVHASVITASRDTDATHVGKLAQPGPCRDHTAPIELDWWSGITAASQLGMHPHGHLVRMYPEHNCLPLVFVTAITAPKAATVACWRFSQAAAPHAASLTSLAAATWQISPGHSISSQHPTD